MDLSQIQKGNIIVDNTIFSLTDLAKETIKIMATKASEKNLDVTTEIDTTLPPLFGEILFGSKKFFLTLWGTPSNLQIKGGLWSVLKNRRNL